MEVEAVVRANCRLEWSSGLGTSLAVPQDYAVQVEGSTVIGKWESAAGMLDASPLERWSEPPSSYYFPLLGRLHPVTCLICALMPEMKEMLMASACQAPVKT